MHIKCLEQYQYVLDTIIIHLSHTFVKQSVRPCTGFKEAGGTGQTWYILAPSAFTDKQTGCYQGIRGLGKKENGVV